MGTRMRDLLGGALPSLRYEPTDKRLRVHLGDQLVADTVGGLLVWEPRRVVPTYAVPERDVVGYLTFDFSAFDWQEEDEPIVAHPHDPFKRIDILASTRRVRVEWEGRLLAESSRPLLLFETLLPVRFYLPRADVVVDLEPTDTISYCAYKGRAAYFSVPDGPADVAWTYHQPLREAEPVTERIAFFNERLDVTVDGRRAQRPVTQWSD